MHHVALAGPELQAVDIGAARQAIGPESCGRITLGIAKPVEESRAALTRNVLQPVCNRMLERQGRDNLG